MHRSLSWLDLTVTNEERTSCARNAATGTLRKRGELRTTAANRNWKLTVARRDVVCDKKKAFMREVTIKINSVENTFICKNSKEKHKDVLIGFHRAIETKYGFQLVNLDFLINKKDCEVIE